MNGLGFTETALEWGVQTVRQEKNIENEGQQTQLHYLLKEKDKHKELSATSVKEVEKEEVRWVAYKQQFFSSIIQPNEPFQRARMASAPSVRWRAHQVLWQPTAVPRKGRTFRLHVLHAQPVRFVKGAWTGF